MRKVALILLFFHFSSLFAINSVDSVFQKSNNLYKSNKFEEAIAGYLSIVNQEINNQVLYYNIGNAYFKINDLGYARLYYEKAKLYSPHNKDINHNIHILKNKLIDDIKVVPGFNIVRLVKKTTSLLSSSQWGVVIIILLYLNLLLFLLFLFSNSIEMKINSMRSLFFILPMLIVVSFFLFYSKTKHQNEAILTSSNIYVKTAPSPSSDDYFIIHEGIKFKIIDELDNWSRVLLSDGKDGWIKNKYFSKIHK